MTRKAFGSQQERQGQSSFSDIVTVSSPYVPSLCSQGRLPQNSTRRFELKAVIMREACTDTCHHIELSPSCGHAEVTGEVTRNSRGPPRPPRRGRVVVVAGNRNPAPAHQHLFIQAAISDTHTCTSTSSLIAVSWRACYYVCTSHGVGWSLVRCTFTSTCETFSTNYYSNMSKHSMP